MTIMTKGFGLCMLLLLVILAIGTAIAPSELDEICKTDNRILKRVAGVWGCYNEFKNTGGTISGDTTINGDITATGNATLNQIYGFMWIHNESNADTPIASANTYYNITQTLKNSKTNGMTFQNNRELRIDTAGSYLINYHIGFKQAGGAGDQWHFAIGINGQEQNGCHTPRKIGTITDFGSAGSTCILTLSINDTITAMIENENDADDANIMDMQITALRTGN